MKRVWAAFWLLVFLAVMIAASSLLVRGTSKTLLAELRRIEQLNSVGEYDAARQAVEEMNRYFARREHWMALFIKRDYLSSIAMCLGGLSAYVGPDSHSDLQSELGKARTQVLMTAHLFFSML